MSPGPSRYWAADQRRFTFMYPIYINLHFITITIEGLFAVGTLLIGFFYQRYNSLRAGYSNDWFVSAYTTAILMGHARGVILLAAALRGPPGAPAVRGREEPRADTPRKRQRVDADRQDHPPIP